MSKGEDTRQHILDRAVALSSVVGLEGITIGKLADELELSKSGLFAHFKSKEGLQLAVLQASADRFTEVVVRPALKEPRGEPRVRALFERWFRWEQHESIPGGCPFVTAAVQFDDQPGPVRNLLVELQKRWIELVTTCIRQAVEAGHFRPTLDAARMAQEMYGLLLAHYHFSRLLEDRESESRTRASFDRLIARSRVL